MKLKLRLLFGIAALSVSAVALEPIASGGKVYINHMEGFGPYIAAAFRIKGVPLTVVANRSVADYEIVGHSESQKAGWAKIIFQRSTRSNEEASMNVIDLRTSEVVFAYNYNMENSYRGKQSAAESCAKHLANDIRRNGRFASSLPPLTKEQIEAREREDEERTAKPGAAQPTVNSYAPPRQSAVLAAAVEPPKKLAITFTSIPAGSEVLIDGIYWGTTPTAAFTNLSTGEHTVVVKKRGYTPWERRITVEPGEPRTVQADLEVEPIDPTKPRVVGLN